MKFIWGMAFLLFSCAFPVFANETETRSVRPTRAYDDADAHPQIERGDELITPLGPVERNRFWQIYNNHCRAPEGLTPTAIETNLCLVVHAETPNATKRRALLTCRRIGALQFYDWQTDMLVQALSRRRTDYFIAAVRLVAAPTRLGRFVLELISDRSRVHLVMTNQQVPLE